MKRYIPKIPSEFEFASQEEVLKGDGELVSSFVALQEKIAKLAYANPSVMLFYRGQNVDYKKGIGANQQSTLLPSLYRNDCSAKELKIRWQKLFNAEKALSTALSLKGKDYWLARRKRLLLWSILQHYEVTETPLIDVTQSLYVACSFALMNNTNEYAYIYIIGLPYVTNRISVNSEEYITNIRLISIAPPKAKRPYFQEGYLVGEDEIMESDRINKEELDLARRVVYKFRISVNSFNEEKISINQEKLLPSYVEDEVGSLCESVKSNILKQTYAPNESEAKVSTLNEFMEIWQQIEHLLIDNFNARDKSGKYSILAAIRNIKDDYLVAQLMDYRVYRNRIVHGGLNVEELDYKIIEEMKGIYNNLKNYVEVAKNRKINI